MRRCLTDDELFALVDGALAPHDSELLRRHLHGCSRCSDAVTTMERSLAGLAEEPSIDVTAHVNSVLAAIDRPAPTERPGPSRGLAIALSALAAAAALVLGVGIGRRHAGEDGFAARGGAHDDAAIGRSVAVTIHAVDGSLTRKIKAGATLPAGTRFVASHRNSSSSVAYALVFALDTKDEIHWLYPAYESANSDPPSVSLAPTQGREVSMESAVAFDDLAPGRLSLVTILSREPLPVSRIEDRSKTRANLELDSLRAAFPEATVTSLDVSILPR